MHWILFFFYIYKNKNNVWSNNARISLEILFLYLCFIITYGNAWGEEKLYYVIIFII